MMTMILVCSPEATAWSHRKRLYIVKYCWLFYLFLGDYFQLRLQFQPLPADMVAFLLYNTNLRVNTESPIITLRYHTFSVLLYH
jgi:hypothetical protein